MTSVLAWWDREMTSMLASLNTEVTSMLDLVIHKNGVNTGLFEIKSGSVSWPFPFGWWIGLLPMATDSLHATCQLGSAGVLTLLSSGYMT